LKRRAQAAKLRSQGLTEAEIGARLGITRQAVHVLLTRYAQDKVPLMGIRCWECGRLATTGYFTKKVNQHVLCLRCVERRPDTPFGTRLKAFRLAAGLTQQQLAERTGIKASTIRSLEGRRYKSPVWPHLLALVKVLGPDLVCLGLGRLPK
jgi:transcriptional regulator with XRE-family HTH domain